MYISVMFLATYISIIICSCCSHLALYSTPGLVPNDLVGTPGLGYPLLLCLGKGLVVILNYIQTSGPLRSGVLLSQQRSGPVPRLGKVRRHHVSRRRQEFVREQPGLRTSQGDRTHAGSRTPHGVPDPLYSNRTPH